MHLALVVVPDLAARLWENGLDRQQEAHLLRLEDAALRIDERDALALEDEARLQFGRGQVIVDFAQPSHMLESRHAHQGVRVVSGHRRHRSSPETMFVVPGQGIGIRTLADVRGRFDLLTVQRVVVLAVIELLPDAPADLEPKIGRYRHIAGVKQAVNVPPQEKSVPCLVRAAVAIGTNVRSLQGRQRPLLGDRAAPPIDIGDQHPERSLSEARPDEVRLAKARAGLGHARQLAAGSGGR